MTDVLETPPGTTEGRGRPCRGRNAAAERARADRLRARRGARPTGRAARRPGRGAAAGTGGRAQSNRSLVQLALTVAVVGGCMVYVLANIHANLVLEDNTPTGGDFGAHVWAPAYLRDHILPHWRLSGWAPDWYAGFPMYKFYMVVPGLLTVLLDVVAPLRRRPQDRQRAGPRRPPAVLLGVRPAGRPAVPDPAAVLDRGGVLPLRLVVHDLRRQRRFDHGGRVLLQHRAVHAMLYLGVLARGMRTGKGRALAAVLFALAVLCHLIVGIFAAVATRADVPALGRSQAHPLRADDGTRWPALLTAFWTPAVPLRRRLHDRHDLRATAGRQRAQRPAGLVLADAVPVHGLDRPIWSSSWPPSASIGCVIRGPTGGRVPRLGGRGVRRVGLHLAAEPPVERPAAAVHVPGPLPAGLHRRLRAGRARRAPRPARAARRRGPHALEDRRRRWARRADGLASPTAQWGVGSDRAASAWCWRR